MSDNPIVGNKTMLDSSHLPFGFVTDPDEWAGKETWHCGKCDAMGFPPLYPSLCSAEKCPYPAWAARQNVREPSRLGWWIAVAVLGSSLAFLAVVVL